MKERGILMSGPNVNPTMDGRKTHTRRTLKIQPGSNVQEIDPIAPGVFRICGDNPTNYDGNVQMNDWSFDVKCPYGAAGDRLWVRETAREFDVVHAPDSLQSAIEYRADNEVRCATSGAILKTDQRGTGNWTPSIFMWRRFSRILLEITEVRVEQLRDISAEDAIAEGIEPDNSFGEVHWKNYDPNAVNRHGHKIVAWGNPVESYRTLWESINGAGSWELNPWVWVIAFKRII